MDDFKSRQRKLHSLRKKMPDGLPEELESMDAEGLKDRVIRCQANIMEVQKELKDNHRLNALKEEIKEIRGPFSDAIKAQRSICEYAMMQLEDKGKVITDEDLEA